MIINQINGPEANSRSFPKMNITEHELGNFLKNKISSLKDHAANRHIKLEIQTEFKYASVWIDQSKISPVIEKFIKNIIDHTEYSKKLLYTHLYATNIG